MITDFGLAKVLESDIEQTQSGATLGTPAYMSPEQAAGDIHQISPATDIYALGVILYELLTGQRPSEQATALATFRSIQLDDVLPPSELRPDVPMMLEAICLNCLEKSPSDRYATGADLAADLNLFLTDEPVLTIPQSAPPQRGRAVRSMTELIAILCLVIAAVVFVPWQQSVDQHHGEQHHRLPTNEANPIAATRPNGNGARDRRVAEFILQNSDGRIHTTNSGRYLSSVTDLSSEPFAVTVAQITNGPQLDDSVIEDLAALPQCYSLAVVQTPLTDKQFERLSRSGITNLTVYNTSVSDSGLRHLARFPVLNYLNLADDDFTDQALPHVEALERLTHLSLTSKQFTDKGLARLKRLMNLRELSLLRSRRISDDGLRHLEELVSLKTLELRETNVTDQGVFALKSKLPQCAVTWDSKNPEIRAAFAILHAKGKMRVAVDARIVPVATPADFPDKPFVVREIDLRDRRSVNDKLLETIRQLRGVESFHLSSLNDTKTGLSFLCDLPSVKRLVLHQVTATDSLIAYVGQLKHLAILEFCSSEVSSAQLARIRGKLPKCEILSTRKTE